MAPEVSRVGPGICSSQWTIERTIGNMGEEIKQHSNPFSNLAQRALRRSQTNALKAMVPDLERADKLPPWGSIDLGNKRMLLRAKDTVSRPVRIPEETVIKTYLRTNGVEMANTQILITRWSRLRLPNDQIARSAWKECLKPLEKVRMARCVKVSPRHPSITLILIFSSYDATTSSPLARSTIISRFLSTASWRLVMPRLSPARLRSG